MPDRRDPRPSVAAEFRAWIAVAFVLLLNMIGGIWWAATLSSQVQSTNTLLVEVRMDMKGFAVKTDVDRQFNAQERVLQDHEGRLRTVERNRP